MGLLSQPLSRGAALFAVVAVGAALSGSVPKRATSLALSQFGYLLSLAMIIGIANWTTFVFGLVAFKTLPRQTFGLLQAKLFPKYFQVCLAQCEPVVATGIHDIHATEMVHMLHLSAHKPQFGVPRRS